MKNTLLIRLMLTLEAEELVQLKQFADNAFFNTRRETRALLDFLIQKQLSKKAIPAKTEAFEVVFGAKQAYNDHRLRMSISFAYALVKQFLAVRHFLQSPQYALAEATVLRQRKQYAQADKHLQAAKQQRDGDAQKNADFFEEDYRLLLEKCRLDMEDPDAKPDNLPQLSQCLDKAYLSRKLWQNCVLLSSQSKVSRSAVDQPTDTLLAQFAESPALQEPAIAIYYHYYLALTTPDETFHYQRFKSLLFEHGACFPASELRDLYLLAINFCIRRYNDGETTFLREQFVYFQKGLEQRFFLVSGELSVYTYLNAATLAFVLGELDWAEQFIIEYQQYLPSSQKASWYNFNLARLAYTRKEHGKALQLLQLVDYKEVLITLAAKTLQMKIYFELDEFDLLDAHLQALKTLLYRKKGMSYHRENYANTFRFMQKILETPAGNSTQRQALRQEIAATKALAEKDWLLEQV